MKTNRRVLVVDDEASVRRQLSVGLVQRGYEVDGCEMGVSAMEKIEAARSSGVPHNFVVLDICLPDIDGLKLLEVIKEAYPDLPVVVISGYGDEDTAEKVKDNRGSAYLDKPFELDELEAEISRIGPAEERPTVPRPEAAPEVQRVESAYVFLRGKPDADLADCFTKLYFADGVCYCDAVMGDWDIVLLFQAPDRKAIEDLVGRTVASFEEIEKSEIHYSERPRLGEDLESFIRNYERMHLAERTGRRNRQVLSAYALLEIEKSRLASLYTKFYFDENVIYCDMTDDCDMAVLLVQGRTFDEIRSAVTRLRSKPGVLRAKILHIMEILAM